MRPCGHFRPFSAVAEKSGRTQRDALAGRESELLQNSRSDSRGVCKISGPVGESTGARVRKAATSPTGQQLARPAQFKRQLDPSDVTATSLVVSEIPLDPFVQLVVLAGVVG